MPVRFGISTHLYHDVRLGREHLAEIARHGFEAVELFATRTHFDYRDPAAVDQLAEWLRETGLALHGMHAPITESFARGSWGPPFLTASASEAERGRAMREMAAALEVARRIPMDVLVVHLGLPKAQKAAAGDNSRDAARRTAEEIHGLAAEVGVRVAFEVIPNELSTPAALVRLLEEDTELPGAGVCLDVGHAHLLGDVVDAVEQLAGHVVSTHVHDNDGRRDDHLVPYEGTIDWARTLTAFQKVGYEGTFLLEVADTGSPAAVLEKARQARGRFERTLAG